MFLKSFTRSGLVLPLVLMTVALPEAALTPSTLAQSSTKIAKAKRKKILTGIVRVDGSANMSKINDVFQRTFEQQYPNATLIAATNGVSSALRALKDGQVDLVAMGRQLTDKEKADGFVAIPVQREKIILIIGGENRFTGSLTTDEFAKIFRGEITNWSEVNGQDMPIRFIDHPEDGDTRMALSRYPAFKSAPFRNGFTTVRLADDRPESIAEELGKDGLAYAVLSEAERIPKALAVPMHQALPGDPRYPFSQYYSYVYRKESLTPGAKAFLKNLQRPASLESLRYVIPPTAKVLLPNQKAVTAALGEGHDTLAQANDLEDTETQAAKSAGPLDWLWVLLLPIGAGIAWWLLKRQKSDVDDDATGTIDTTNAAANPPQPAVRKPSVGTAAAAGGVTMDNANGDKVDTSLEPSTAESEFPVKQLPADEHPPMPTDKDDIPFGPGRETATAAHAQMQE